MGLNSEVLTHLEVGEPVSTQLLHLGISELGALGVCEEGLLSGQDGGPASSSCSGPKFFEVSRG